MISDTYICKTHVFKVVLSLSLLNFWDFLNVKEKWNTNCFPISQKKIFSKKYISIFTLNFGGLSLVGDRRQCPKWTRPRAGPNYTLRNPSKITKTLVLMIKCFYGVV